MRTTTWSSHLRTRSWSPGCARCCAGPAAARKLLVFADLELDLLTRDARRDGREIELSPIEFELLEFFLRHPRQVLSRGLIYERVWGHDVSLSSNSLDVFVGHLRRKLEAGGERRLIQTVRGVGFTLRER